MGKEDIIVLLRTISLDYIDSQTAGHVHSCHVQYGESARVCPLVSHQWSFLSYQETAPGKIQIDDYNNNRQDITQTLRYKVAESLTVLW